MPTEYFTSDAFERLKQWRDAPALNYVDDRAAFEGDVRRLIAECEGWRQSFGDLHNKHRHEFSKAVEEAADKLFKACSFWDTARLRNKS